MMYTTEIHPEQLKLSQLAFIFVALEGAPYHYIPATEIRNQMLGLAGEETTEMAIVAARKFVQEMNF